MNRQRNKPRETDDDVQPADAGLDEETIRAEEALEDDNTPDRLVDEDEEQPPAELYGASPADEDLTVVNKQEIGGGQGADEAELARVHPLDGKPWDGDEEELLPPDPSVAKDYPEQNPKGR